MTKPVARDYEDALVIIAQHEQTIEGLRERVAELGIQVGQNLCAECGLRDYDVIHTAERHLRHHQFVAKVDPRDAELAAVRREVGADDQCQREVSTGVKCGGLPDAHRDPSKYEPEPTIAAIQRLTRSFGVMQDDMVTLMTTLGISTHARDASPHEVMVQEIIPAVQRAMKERMSDSACENVAAVIYSRFGVSVGEPARKAAERIAQFIKQVRGTGAKS